MNCTRCILSKTRKRIVRGTGNLPCSYLIVGNGITRAEESLGLPFLGLKKQILEHLLLAADIDLADCYFTNIVLCRSDGEISDKSKIACSQHIMEIYDKSGCDTVILIGTVVKEFYGKTFPDVVSIMDLRYIAEDGGTGGSYYYMMLKRLKEARIEKEKITKEKKAFKGIGFRY